MSDTLNVQDAYDARVQSQITQYVDQPVHDLPEIFHNWSYHFIRPGMIDVFGVDSINDIYKEAISQATSGFEHFARVLSVGCGDGDIEIQLAESLLQAGHRQFLIEGVDISPIMIDRFNHKIRARDLSNFMRAEVRDFNISRNGQEYDVVMANHSLHHILELEKAFDFIYSSLTANGIFATCDMIGRNGHMRWPETEAIVQVLWPLLSDRQTFHHQLLRSDRQGFVDHDCSNEGFEGIRAQDILYLILNRFKPYRFFAFGGFIEVLVDRGYGPGFDADNAWDREFIMAMARLNDMMLDSCMIKPTSMMAYFTKADMGTKWYREREPRRCVRMPYEDPMWASGQ